MFALTCPSCRHAVRVRYARYNAMATCPACSVRFRVNEQNTSIDRDGAVGGPLHDLEQQSPMPAGLPVRGGSSPAAFSTHRGADEPSADEIWDELFGEAPEPPRVHEAPLEWQQPRRKFAIPNKIPTPIAAVMILGSAIFAGMFVNAMSSAPPPPQERLVVNPAEPVDSSRRSEERDSRDSSTSEAPSDTSDPPDAGSGTDAPSPPSSPSTDDDDQQVASASTSSTSPGGTSGDPALEGVDRMPMMQLQRSIAFEPRWDRLGSARQPMYPTMRADVLLWMPRIQRCEETERSMFTAMFLAESDQVYQSGFLHVQLVDEDGMAFAELKQVVPVLNAGQGLQVRLIVPEDLEDRSQDVVAQFVPVDPLTSAAPVEAVESRTRVHRSTDGVAIELAVANPHTRPVTDPTVVVELLTRDGWPVAMYRGVVRGTIEPGGSLTFVVRPPEADDLTDAGRVQVRGYAFRED